jgi:hypothetical protein
MHRVVCDVDTELKIPFRSAVSKPTGQAGQVKRISICVIHWKKCLFLTCVSLIIIIIIIICREKFQYSEGLSE